MPAQDKVDLRNLLRQFGVHRHAGMRKSDNQLAPQPQKNTAHLPCIFHDIKVLQLFRIGGDKTTVKIWPRQAHESNLDPAVLLDKVVQSLPDILSIGDVLDIPHQPGTADRPCQLEGMFWGKVKIVVAVTGNIDIQHDKTVRHLFSLQRTR